MITEDKKRCVSKSTVCFFGLLNRSRSSIRYLFILAGTHKQVKNSPLYICLKSLLQVNRLSFVGDIIEVDRPYPRKEISFSECEVQTVQRAKMTS